MSWLLFAVTHVHPQPCVTCQSGVLQWGAVCRQADQHAFVRLPGMRPDAAAACACLLCCTQPLASPVACGLFSVCPVLHTSLSPVDSASASVVQVIGLAAAPTAPADILRWQKTLPGAPWSYLALVVLAYCTYEQASFVAARCAGRSTLQAGVQGQCCTCHLQLACTGPGFWHGMAQLSAGSCSRIGQMHRATGGIAAPASKTPSRL